MKIKVTIIVLLVLGLVANLVLGQHDVEIEVEDGTLYGTLRHESDDVLAIIIAGSGPTDRDGNSDMLDGRNDSLKELALALNEKGISTFNYDKRSSGRSVETFDMDNVVFDDFISDGQTVLEDMISRGYESIVLIGHSQGALVAEVLGDRPEVKGVVSLAGTVRSIDEVLIEQFRQGDATTAAAAERIITAMKNGDEGVEIPETLEPIFGVNNDFLRNYMVYEPMEYVDRIQDKLLFIYGDFDTQVSAAEVGLIDGIYEVEVVSGMNHVLKLVENVHENTDSYIQPIYPIHEEVVDILSTFILQ